MFKIIANILLKKHQTFADNPAIQIYKNKIDNRIILEIKTAVFSI